MSRALLLLPGLLGVCVFAAEPDQLFLRDVEPVLKRECQGCHGEVQALGKLDLRTREALLKGGTRGAAVIPGSSEQSLLYRLVLGGGELQMPPGGPEKRLPAPVIASIKAWIDGGAPWPAAPAEARRWDYKPEDLWAFQPRTKPAIPATGARHPVDAFITAKLTKTGLNAAPRAGRRTLIRRATIDLTGLPPAPEEVEAFVTDSSADAWEKLIDRLLASPRYGERWGRHWLDVVRYADSSGYSNDFERPNAWRYRDYVIRSFQSGKPYDQFIREQIAGDELYPDKQEAIIATGFLRAGPWEHTGMSVEAVTRQMFLDDVTHAAGTAFLGVTLGCARCHDHKFDPIPTRDYYRMQAIFATTEFARPRLPFLSAENIADLPKEKERIRTFVRATQASMAAFDERVKQHMMRKLGVARVEDIPKDVLAKAIREKDGIGPEEFEEYKLHQKHMQLYRETLDRFEAKAFAVSSGPLDGFTDGGPNLRYPPRAKYQSPETHILTGGNLQSPADKVEPGVMELVARYGKLPAPQIPGAVSGRRSALANWIADPRHPLTARVMVNRIWQYHFGKSLSVDPNNLGKMGGKPSHPELLDWLASYFIENNWSVKAMHRLLMRSDAYQRASAPADAAYKTKDPENRLLSFYPPRRVEAEVIRDSMLAIAGELSLEAGGPGVFPQINEDVARQPLHRMGTLAPAYHPSAEKRMRNRRTVYTFQQRSMMDPMVEVFNGANMDISCERRETSTVPTQAFALMNGQFVNDMALAFAARLGKETPDREKQIRRAFQLAFGRAPEAEEIRLAKIHLDKQTAHYRAAPAPPAKPAAPIVHSITSELTGETSRFVQQADPATFEANLHPSEVSPETRALAGLTLALFNSNEFVYIY